MSKNGETLFYLLVLIAMAVLFYVFFSSIVVMWELCL